MLVHYHNENQIIRSAESTAFAMCYSLMGY